MATRRTKSISTKVTDAEYEQAASAAAPLTISEWARNVLLHATQPDPIVTALLAEVLDRSDRELCID
jgi:anti-sigma regulatory factor (Ser/Thr protein kinase)